MGIEQRGRPCIGLLVVGQVLHVVGDEARPVDEPDTRRTEPSKYLEEKKSTEIPQVVASERERACT